MYRDFFNFRLKPFDLTPNPDFIYLSRSHKKAITFLDYGIRQRAGFILLTGDVGSGKTTIIRDILNNRYEDVQVAKIFNTKITSEQLISMINDEFGLDVAGKDKITLLRELNIYLIEQFSKGNHPVLIIDEAQNLGGEILEEIRMLSNLETSDSKLLQIILVGQPELRAILADPSLMQLRQRVSINCILKPLEPEEIQLYITHRLEVAGNRNAVTFGEGAFDLIHIYTRGIPRLINILCDFLLLAAFADDATVIDEAMIREIADDLDFETHYWGDDENRQNKDNGLSEKSELAEAIKQFTARIERLEKNLNPVNAESIAKEINYKLGSLQSAFKFHVGETESMLTDLHRKYEQIKKRVPENFSHSAHDIRSSKSGS